MAAHQAPLSLGFSRQEHWSGFLFPSPMHESEKWKWSRSVVSDFSGPMGCGPPGSPSMGFSRQEWWSGVPLPSLDFSFSSVQFSSVTQSCPTLCDPMNRSTPGLPVHHQLPEFIKLMSIESVMPSNYLILCRPLFLLPPIPPSIRVFSNEPTLRMRWPKYWSFSFSIIPSKEHPGLISFRMDWLDLLAVQGTLKSLLQHHSSKASILQH